MTKSEFQSEIKTLASCFPKFRPESWKGIYEVYYDNLCHFPVAAIKSACTNVVQNPVRLEHHSGEFPSAGELFGLCREYMRSRSTQSEVKVNFPPAKHVCHPKAKDGKYGRASSARLMLHKLNRYEALHVKCPGQFNPVCPICGNEQEPWVNPFIKGLIEMYPQDTLGWNPMHKGLLLCAEHSKVGALQ